MQTIAFVKKIKADGKLCRKCADVSHRLEQDGLLVHIDRVIIANEREPEGAGTQLARQHEVDRAPFFIVEDDSGRVRVYTVYYRFVREVVKRPARQVDELVELINMHPELDYV
jgi:hypothetical protein